MEQGLISNDQLSTSSGLNTKNGARLYQAGWKGTSSDSNPWLQVDLQNQHQFVFKIATQGYGNLGIWTKEFYLTYSMDSEIWVTYVGLQNKEKVREMNLLVN